MTGSAQGARSGRLTAPGARSSAAAGERLLVCPQRGRSSRWSWPLPSSPSGCACTTSVDPVSCWHQWVRRGDGLRQRDPPRARRVALLGI